MKKAVLLCLFASLAAGATAQTAQTLRPGDVALVGFNADDPDQFAFVTLVDLVPDAQVVFTDKGWQASTNMLRVGEGEAIWTAQAAVPAGTVITITNDGAYVASRDSVFSEGGLQLATDGDQLLAYQGEEAAPSFLYGLNSEGDTWQDDATTARESALPPGLETGVTAVALSEVDNAIYAGPTSGTRAELLAAISDPANWTGDNGERQTMPAGPFEVTDAGTALVTLAAARDASEGALITTQGIVTRAKGGTARIQDETAGLTIRQTSGPFAEAIASGDVALGDSLRITGAVSEADGLKVIEGDALQVFEVRSRGNALPEPQEITLAEIAANGEVYESELVVIGRFNVDNDGDSAFQAEKAYLISDATLADGSVVLYIPGADETDLDGEPLGDSFSFQGVLGQSDEGDGDAGYRLVAIEATDLEPVVADAVEDEAVPDVFTLRGNYPNPFNPTTTLRFDLAEPAWVSVRVFDLTGREVLTLGERLMASGADHALLLEASDLASGLYLYRVTARAMRRTQSRAGLMTLVR